MKSWRRIRRRKDDDVRLKREKEFAMSNMYVYIEEVG